MISTNPPEVKTFDPNFPFCAGCKQPLEAAYITHGRTIYTLTKILHVRGNVKTCSNKNCRFKGKKIEPYMPAPKGCSVGFDVLAEIGCHLTHENKTLDEVRNWLEDNYSLEICVKSVANYRDRFLWLLGSEPSKTDLNNLRSRGNVVISIDGIEPNKGHDILYIVRDVTSSMILAAEVLEKSATQDIIGFLQKIVEMQLPIVGIVSDKQASIVKAVQTLFPSIPYQLCQLHFIQAISKVFNARDKIFQQELKASLHSISTIFTKSMKDHHKEGKISDDQYNIIQDLHRCIKAIVTRTKKYPNKTVGIQLHDDLTNILETLEMFDDILPLDEFRYAIDILRPLLGLYEQEYQALQDRRSFIEGIQECLISKKSTCREDLIDYIEDYIDHAKLDMVAHAKYLLKMTKRWLGGLFEYLKHPKIPRTNGALESFINITKRKHRKITGQKHNGDSLLRRGPYLAQATQYSHKEAEKKIRSVNNETEKAKRAQFEELNNRRKTIRQALVNLQMKTSSLIRQLKGVTPIV